MTTSPENDHTLDEILATYLESVEAGAASDCADLAARHPDWADRLREFFADQDRFAALLKPLCAPALPRPCAVPAAGEQIGEYELLEEVGRGGMGVVFKARQISLPRTVALKMILAGRLASPAERQRFRLEAEAAARLDHPHIVPMYEVGAHQDVPFYSMKFIPGGSLAGLRLPRPLSPADQKATARLLATVAEAVHHAHERGILHRDLKPSNILLAPNPKSEIRNPKQIPITKEKNAEPVSELGHSDLGIVSNFELRISDFTPYVTDFGLAKHLDEDGALSPGLATPPGAAVGTPSYMAPEQALGPKAVTTAADVYSLGCILYELLTGGPPFRGESPLATLLGALERTPPRPGALCPGLDRDLETVCLKCLEKNPHRRYRTAAALAEDLHRFAAGEPIHGRPTPPLERVRRWCRRQPLLAGSLAALAIVIPAAFALVAWQWQRAERNARESQLHEAAARREQEASQRNFQLAEERFRLADDLVDEFCVRLSEERLKHLPGTQALRKDLLERAGRYYRSFLEQKGEDASVRRRLARARHALAAVQDSLGSRAEALENFQAALDLCEDPGADDLQTLRARTLHRMGLVHSGAGRWTSALDYFTQARAAFQMLAERAPGDLALQTDLAAVLANMGNLYRFRGDLAGALTYLEQALAIRKRVAAAAPGAPRFQSPLAATSLNYGNLVGTLGRRRECLECYRLACSINEKLLEASPRAPDLQSDLALTLRLIGEHQRLNGHPEEARQTFKDVRLRLERLVRDNPDVVLYRRDLAATYREMGHLESAAGKKNEALKWYRQGRDVMEQARALQPELPEIWNDLAKCWFDMGGMYAAANPRSPDARLAFEEARGLREKVIAACPDHPGYRHDLALTCFNLAAMLSNQGRAEEAVASAQRAVAEERRLLEVAPQVANYRRACGGHLGLLAGLQWAAGDYEHALASARARADLWPRDSQELYAAARDFAQDALKPGRGASRRGSAEPGDRAERLVIELLRRATAAGFRDGQRLQQEEAFAPLRPRSDYQQLVAGVK
jgi:serine/threonine protein kinase/tetratricopeptide (TPR) repeat protein